MSKLNFSLDADDYHEPHRVAAIREGVTLGPPPFPWLTLFLVADVMVVFTVVLFA